MIARTAAAIVALSLAGSAVAQDRTDPVPQALARVGIEEKLNTALPLQLAFKDERGRDVTLGSYFHAGRPVILTLNYYRCPMLCTLELNGLVTAMKDLAWSPGAEFQVVTVSIDPREMPPLAAAKRAGYLRDLGRPGADEGWHFLTGDGASIRRLAASVGFSYEYDEATDQYGHAAVVVLATPDGRVARYLYGVQFEADTLKLGLLEASQGTIGSPWDRFILYCYRYDAARGSYALAARKLMRAGGVVTMILLGAMVGTFWWRERHR